MFRYLIVAFAVVVAFHGLIHLMGFVAYWPLAEVAELPYKTSLGNGRWQVGEGGMRVYSLLWLLVAVGFVAAATGVGFRYSWWVPVMLVAALLSLLVTVPDWSNAFRGFIISGVILIATLLAFGLQVRPAPFAPYSGPKTRLTTIQLPDGLPAPVARYGELVSNDGGIPEISTLLLNSRGTLRFAGIPFPARFRFTVKNGQAYRHDIQVTFYGRTLMNAYEVFQGGHLYMETPGGIIEDDPQADEAASLALWVDSLMMPSELFTNPQVRWEPIDDTSAHLVVPFGETENVFTVVFDPVTGLLQYAEAMRYRDSDGRKLMWRAIVGDYQRVDGVFMPTSLAAQWEDEAQPWLDLVAEDVAFNVPVADAFSRR